MKGATGGPEGKKYGVREKKTSPESSMNPHDGSVLRKSGEKVRWGVYMGRNVLENRWGRRDEG